MTYCVNDRTELTAGDVARCPSCQRRHASAAATNAKFIASPDAHLWCCDCGAGIPSGHVRCRTCFDKRMSCAGGWKSCSNGNCQLFRTCVRTDK